MSYLTRTQAAKILSVSPNTLSVMVKDGRVRCVRTSDGPRAHFRFLASDIYAMARKTEGNDDFFKKLAKDPKPGSA